LSFLLCTSYLRTQELCIKLVEMVCKHLESMIKKPIYQSMKYWGLVTFHPFEGAWGLVESRQIQSNITLQIF